jgi:hypothetical protein
MSAPIAHRLIDTSQLSTELVGGAEILAMLAERGRTVSRHRIGELTRHRKFPPPVATLRMGQVWLRGDVARFLDTPRPVGRRIG